MCKRLMDLNPNSFRPAIVNSKFQASEIVPRYQEGFLILNKPTER
jgi:hypothetical protein